MDRRAIMVSVEGASHAVDGCLANLFKTGGKKGNLAFFLGIDLKGKLKSSKMKVDDFQDKKMVQCFEGAIKKIEWPKPSSGDATFTLEWRIESLG